MFIPLSPIEVEEYEKAIKQFEEVIKKIIGVLTDKYASPCYVHSILLEIVVCLCKLGRTEESLTMAKGIIEQFPKVISMDLLLSVLLHSGLLCLANRVRFENLRKLCICYSNADIEPPKGSKKLEYWRIIDKTRSVEFSNYFDSVAEFINRYNGFMIVSGNLLQLASMWSSLCYSIV